MVARVNSSEINEIQIEDWGCNNQTTRTALHCLQTGLDGILAWSLANTLADREINNRKRELGFLRVNVLCWSQRFQVPDELPSLRFR